MKKIAIITHSLRYNYGGILQNYALQQVLKKMGYSPTTLKLNRKDTFVHKIGVAVKRTIFGILRRPYNVITYNDIDKLCTNTDKFIESNIVMSPRMNTINKHWVRGQRFDAFVIGSDQVLHPSSYPKIEEVYLDFIKNNFKLMYAASFGVESWKYSEMQTANCKKLVKEFKAVSVRENSAVCHMKEKFDIDATLVIDPTLLLTDKEYKPFIKENAQHLGVVTYILDPTDEKQSIIDKVSSCLGIQEFKANNDKMDNDNTKLEDRITPSVEEWLTSLYNADFIVTDSYHGTLFSIIFKKNFICIGNKKRGLDRFKTILDKLDLTNRMVFEEKECTDVLLHDAVRYDEVNKRLEVFRQQSLDFLSKNLP